METTELKIDRTPAVLYGAPAERVWLCVHGKHGCKEEARTLAEIACPGRWQVLGVDLPEHGGRRREEGTFDPWHAVPELQAVNAFLAEHWARRGLYANSIGAWFSMLASDGALFQRCLFLSPVLDMPVLIRTMMAWAGVTEQELRERRTIETSFGEALSWDYYQYAIAHAVLPWHPPTAVLYAGGDTMTSRGTVEAFCARPGRELTVMEDGEHWFHTPEQLSVLRSWLEAQLAKEKGT